MTFVVAYTMPHGEPPKKMRERCALLMGGYSDPDWLISAEIDTMYKSLVDGGMKPENIIVLLGAEKSYGDYKVNGRLTRESLDEAIAIFAEHTTKDELVMIHLSSHGNIYGEEGIVKLNEKDGNNGNGEWVQASELATLIHQIKAGVVIVTFDSCFAGDIVARVGGGNVVAISPCSGSEFSVARGPQSFGCNLYRRFTSGYTIGESFKIAAEIEAHDMKKSSQIKADEPMKGVRFNER